MSKSEVCTLSTTIMLPLMTAVTSIQILEIFLHLIFCLMLLLLQGMHTLPPGAAFPCNVLQFLYSLRREQRTAFKLKFNQRAM